MAAIVVKASISFARQTTFYVSVILEWNFLEGQIDSPVID